jgi:glycosyltransferase involved in cell wall biosynthesis
MNIWFAAAIPDTSHGGVGRVMRELAAGLTARGHSCRIIYAGRSQFFQNYLVFSVCLMTRLAIAFKNRPDWIIARSTDGVFCIMLVRLVLLKTKVALHCHGWEEKVFDVEKRLPRRVLTPKTTWKARLVRFPLLRRMLAVCDLCICGTLEEARWVKIKYPLQKRRIVVVPNGVSEVRFPHCTRKAPPAPRFLAVGASTWKKNIAHTVAVFQSIKKSIPEAELCVVGCSIEELAALLRGTLPYNVSAVRGVPPKNMTQWYASCPFFITSSRYEGGRSLAMLEAMSHGCVVFASAIPSAMECIIHAQNGFIVPSVDPEQDAAIIVKVVATPELCAAVSKKAFLFGRRQSWRRQTLRCERVLCDKQ